MTEKRRFEPDPLGYKDTFGRTTGILTFLLFVWIIGWLLFHFVKWLLLTL